MSVGIGEIVQVTAEMLLAGQRVLNVFHAVCASTTSDSGAVSDLCVQVDNLYKFVDDIMADDLTFTQLSLKNITDGTDLGIHAWPTMVAGLNGNDPLPNGVAGLVTLSTAQSKVRGRKFLAGIAENLTSGSVFTGSTVLFLANFGVGLLTAFTGSTSGNLWVWGVPTSTGGFQRFTAAQTTNIPAYQRRRKQGVGS